MSAAGDTDPLQVFAASVGGDRSVDLVWAADGLRPPDARRGGNLAIVRESPLGRAVRARGISGQEFLVEFPPGRVPAGGGGAAPPPNAVVASRWRRLAESSSRSPSAALLPPEARALAGPRYAPLFLCIEKGVTFHPPCPTCGLVGLLDECTDDGARAAVGRPAWAGSRERFTWCPRCSSSPERLRLYSPEPNLDRDTDPRLRTSEAFIRDLGDVVLGQSVRTVPESTAAHFPCVRCDQADVCFPSAKRQREGERGQAHVRLEPVAFLPFRAVARPEPVLDYVEHLDAKGGSPWRDFRRRHGARWATRALRGRREALESTLFPRVRAVEPLAALQSRLALFEGLVAAVRDYHRLHGQPHLGLGPATLASCTPALEPREAHAVDLLDPLATVPLALVSGDPAAPAFWLPPPDVRAPYAHADLLPSREGGHGFGEPVRVEVVPGRVWEDPESGAVTVEVDLRGPDLPAGDLHASDRIALRIDGPGWEGVVLWCRAEGEAYAGAGARRFHAGPVRLLPTQQRDIDGARKGGVLGGTATPYRSFGAFYDIHALGVLLLRTLVDNSESPFEETASLLVPPLAAAALPSGAGDPWTACLQAVERVANSAPLRGYLGPENSCFLPSELRGRAAAVPRGTWLELLGTVATCLAVVPGLTFADGTRLEDSADRVAEPAGRLLGEIHRLRQALEAAGPEVAEAAPADGGFAAGGLDAAALESENRLLVERLREREARLQRLESELASLRDAPDAGDDLPTGVFSAGGDPGSAEAWRDLLSAMLDTTAHPFGEVRPGSPEHAVMRAALAEGLEALNALRKAVGELGGGDLAEEQRNLRRMIRLALMPARDRPPDPRRVAEAIEALKQTQQTVGRTISLLVEAHQKSVHAGLKQILYTMRIGVKKELNLKASDQEAWEKLVSRMDEKRKELEAHLFDRAFQDHIREKLRG